MRFNWRYDVFNETYNLKKIVNIFEINNNKYYQLEEMPFYDVNNIKKVRVFVDTGAEKIELTEVFTNELENNQFKVDYIPDPNNSLIKNCKGTGKVKINSTISQYANVIIEYYGMGSIDFVLDGNDNYEISRKHEIESLKMERNMDTGTFMGRLLGVNGMNFNELKDYLDVKQIDQIPNVQANNSGFIYYNGIEAVFIRVLYNYNWYIVKIYDGGSGGKLFEFHSVLPENLDGSKTIISFLNKENGFITLLATNASNISRKIVTGGVNFLTDVSGTVTYNITNNSFYTNHCTYTQIGNLIYIFGASSTNGTTGDLAYVWNPYLNTFTSLTNVPIQIGGIYNNRQNSYSCVYNGDGKIIILGSYYNTVNKNNNTYYTYDILNNSYISNMTSELLYYPQQYWQQSSNYFSNSINRCFSCLYKKRYVILFSVFNNNNASYNTDVYYNDGSNTGLHMIIIIDLKTNKIYCVPLSNFFKKASNLNSFFIPYNQGFKSMAVFGNLLCLIGVYMSGTVPTGPFTYYVSFKYTNLNNIIGNIID